MSYQIIFSKSSREIIKKLDTVTKKRIGKRIRAYSKDPLAYAKRLITSNIGSYRWRIGDYRVIFDVKSNTIIVLKIGHRKEIYKK